MTHDLEERARMMKLKMQAYKQSGPVSDTEATYRARSRDRSGGTRGGSSSRDRMGERAYEKNRDPLYKGHRTRRRNDPGEWGFVWFSGVVLYGWCLCGVGLLMWKRDCLATSYQNIAERNKAK